MNLPDELILNILLRLPLKSLLRFKSVSKRWRSLISDPAFTQSHFDRSSSLADRIVLLAGSEVRSIDLRSSFHDDSAVVKLNFPITTPPIFVKIWGSCRGFVLLYDYANFFVWNPSTSFYKRLPYFPRTGQFYPFILGFGYDASDDDYLVVLASDDPSYANFASDFQFFSMKANSWKKIEGTQYPYTNVLGDPKAGWLLNEAIHWLAFRLDISVKLILAFNVIERNLMEIPLPDDFCDILALCDLGALGGCLSLCVVSDEKAEIWLMKEYGVKSSWTKSIVVSFAEIPSNYFVPICFTESGEVVGTDGGTGLVKYNAEGEVVEHRAYNYQWRWLEAVRYTESLLSLPCDSGEAGEEDTQQPTIMNEEDWHDMFFNLP